MTDMPVEMQFDPIASRQEEVDQYTQTICVYTSILESTPSEWPERLQKYKSVKDRHSAIAEIEDLDDVTLVSNLWAHDDAHGAIRANMVERAKAQAILDAQIVIALEA